jgi:hypothetical protein
MATMEAEMDKAVIRRIYDEARHLVHGQEGWDAFYALLVQEVGALQSKLEAAERVWMELSSIVGCTSTSGDAELDQVRLAYEQRAELERQMRQMRLRWHGSLT